MNAKFCKLLRGAARLTARRANLPPRGHFQHPITGAVHNGPFTERGVYRHLKAEARRHG